MTDKGVYIQLWRKYLPVIRLLLKKTGKGEQKLQLYKHEFEKTGAKNKLGYIFSIHLINGKPATRVAPKAVSSDLMTVMSESSEIMEWLKDQNIMISTNRACELLLQKVEQEEVAQPEEPAVASS